MTRILVAGRNDRFPSLSGVTPETASPAEPGVTQPATPLPCGSVAPRTLAGESQPRSAGEGFHSRVRWQDIDCRNCDGAGRIHGVLTLNPSESPRWRDCPECGGKGRV